MALLLRSRSPLYNQNFQVESRAEQKYLSPRNKKKFTKIAFQIFVNFGLFPKELLFAPDVYSRVYSKTDF
ncbi:hypothetical protein U0C78_03335 [Enterococcus durans]|uniref:Uncharacterized protein n=1 Tax=Enterococcus durans TaxID=53345 RepID=A0AB36S8C4_9ENTE|nr:hypothetical protein [Enterococcus durans]QCJ63711.1 hypothetical protein C9423_04835 [Lactobacillus sp. Koumiss]PEH45238.1 hypothetical protein CRM96_09535 [Enterococcus durans]RSL37504.1 hypothetical protein B7758_01780 [Enterococcus durans]RXE80728.1 hypothetical protein EIA52_04115 [Enterococcus durans]RYT07208.1 hypothetical protein EAI85_08505 [Enterococcus durans]